jgi:hypothetical protein
LSTALVIDRTVREWTKNLAALDKFGKQVLALSLYLAGKTEEEIAVEVRYADESAVRKILEVIRKPFSG